METIVWFVVEVVAISAAMYIIYWLLFRGKASHVAQRVMLLSIPIVALVSALVSERVVALDGFAADVVSGFIEQHDSEPIAAAPVEAAQEESFSPDEFRVESGSAERRDTNWGMVAWCAVSFILILLYIYRLSLVVRMRKSAESERCKDYTLYRLRSGNMLFSFWRGIYISKELDGERLELFMRHELGHIRHRHYIDKFIIELYSIVLWFNPVVWLMQREIELVHEFEADHDVVSSGCNLKLYWQFLFEEVTAEQPMFGSGLSSSMIKKRFLSMKSDYRVTHRVLRTVVTSLAMILIVMSSIVYVRAEEAQKDGVRRFIVSHKTITTSSDSFRSELSKIDPDDIQSIEVRNGDVVVTEKDSSILVLSDGRIAKFPSMAKSPYATPRSNDKVVYAPHIDAEPSQYYLAKDHSGKDIYVVRCEDHTKVFLAIDLMWNRHWFTTESNMALVNPKSYDRYMVHSAMNGLPIDKVVFITNQRGKRAYVGLIFPPLPKDLNVVNLRETCQYEVSKGYSKIPKQVYPRTGFLFFGVKVQNKMPDFVSKEYQEDVRRKPRVIKLDKDFKVE